MSRIQVDSGIPFRREQPQTQVTDTFVGLRAPGPQLQRAAELPRWQSELFDVAQALSGLSGTLNSLSRTWGDIGSKQETAVGEQMFAGMTPEQQRDAAALQWADLEKQMPELKGASPWRRLAIKQAAGKAAVESQLGKVFSENAERMSDPNSDVDPRQFASENLQRIMEGIDGFYGRDAALKYGSDMSEKFVGMVEEAKRKRTVLVNDMNFQSEVRDLLMEGLSDDNWPEDFSGSVAGRVKEIQDKYHTITGESGNLAVFEATRDLAETLISGGRYDDARELIRSMNDYSHNGQIPFGKLFAEQFAALIDKADDKESGDTRANRQETAFRLSQAATNAVFKLDANTLGSMTEGDMKALAQEATAAAGYGPEYFGEMYDSLLSIRDGQLQRLERGKDGDKEDLRLMMSIRRDSMKPGTDLDALEEQVHAAFGAGQLKKDTAVGLLGQIENARNHYGDNASPLVREQRVRLERWINPQTLPPSAMPGYSRIVSDLQAEFDERVIAARAEVMAELDAKKIPVNPDSINQFLGTKARVIADEMMQRAEEDFTEFRNRYEPGALMREYTGASPFLQQSTAGVLSFMGDIASSRATADPRLAEAIEGDKFRVQSAIRKKAAESLRKFSAEGLEGQELYDAVDAEVNDYVTKQIIAPLRNIGADTPSAFGKGGSPNWPLWESARAANRAIAETGAALPAVPEEFAGLTQAGRFGNTFRSWVEELGATDPGELATAKSNTRVEAVKFVTQVGQPRSSGIEIAGDKIKRGGEIDQEATATYWNAKVQWSGLSISEVKNGRTEEGLGIPTQYLLSPYTRIKGLDTEQLLRAALVEYETSGGGILADYMAALPSEYAPRDIVDLLRFNLREIGVTE